MPTIDQLDAAVAVADTDGMMVSQSGTDRKATRAQVVAGLQPLLAVAAGQLLGRVSTGTGTPEPISLGANLTLAGGTLAAYPSTPSIATFPAGATPSPADLVPAAQGGRNVAIPFAGFMAGLTGVSGLDGSNLGVLPPIAAVPRRLADIAADALSVESFGAKGDGVTDDTTAFVAAIGSGHPLRLGAKTYVVNGQFTIATPNTVLFGTPGQTILQRHAQAAGGGAWISIQATGFRADGVTFDANRATVAQESWCILVTSACTSSDFHRCAFVNASGPVLGNGLTFQASDPNIVQHVVRDCEFANNAAHGVWVQACAGVVVEGCRAHDNAQYGICADYNDVTFVQKVRLAQISGCSAWNNIRGISIGNFNVTNTQPPVWGNANPDAIDVLVNGNVCHDNSVYGIAVSGRALAIQNNVLSNNGSTGTSGAGILANVSYSRVAGNMITGAALFGIDCGGAIVADVVGNYVDGAVFGINCGGTTAVRIAGNSVQDCTSWAIVANNVEADGNGQNFGIACSLLAIVDNAIGINSATANGVLLRDGPQNVLVARNAFTGTNGAALGNCLWANTDSVVIENNLWNATPRFTANPIVYAGMQTIVFPDIADTIMVTSAAAPVQSMLSSYQVLVVGQVTFIRVTASGQGYTQASVSIGGVGSGAQATAVISNGAVIGVAVTSPGSGYGAIGAAVPVTITGDGTGAQATGFAGAPLPEERRLRVRCNGPVVFARAGSQPSQENATLNDLLVPANGDVDWVGTFGQWRAVRSTPSILVGCVGTTGHGSPEGVITAPPGSDYRNLDGGAGQTLWVKRTGTGPTGWFAVA